MPNSKSKTKSEIVLIVVESPTKILKIKKILAKLYPKNEYIIMATLGHIIDLPSKSMSIDFDNDYKLTYEAMDNRKKKIISDLRKTYKKCDRLVIATDKDREGEMIGWSVAEKLGVKNPDRIVFTSITDDDIKRAMENPTKINMNEVGAQQGRRSLDRYVGYALSPLLWKSGNPTLSAGRVQSVMTKLIIEKEKEIEKFMKGDSKSSYKFNGEFRLGKPETLLKTTLVGQKKKTPIVMTARKDVKINMKQLSKSKFTVDSTKTGERKQNPSLPYTTSSLQQDGVRKLGWGIKKVMMVAQKLYEKGHITYMRTDSTNLSGFVLKQAKELITKEYGAEYLQHRNVKVKGGKIQEGHEAIRPSTLNKKGIEGPSDEIRLYNLIWKRTVSSQMKPAVYETQTVFINVSKLEDNLFSGSIEYVSFPGFLVIYGTTKTKKSDKITIKDASNAKPIKVISKEEYKKPPSRFDEASLVNKMDPKNLNIGRPATYVASIEKMQRINYVEIGDVSGKTLDVVNYEWKYESKGDQKIKETDDKIIIGGDKKKFIPTETGKLVTEFLQKYFPTIMEYKFTAEMESKLDKVESGDIKWQKVMGDFYKDINPIITKVSGKDIKLFSGNDRSLGKDEDGNEYIVTMGKYGHYVKKMDINDKNKGSSPIRKPLTKDNIKLTDALELFKWPKLLGKISRTQVKFYKNGKFGPYVKVGKDSFSVVLTKEFTVDDVDLKYVETLIAEKKKKDLWEDSDETRVYTLREGPYGKYVSIRNVKGAKKKPFNVNIPDDTDIAILTIKMVQEFAEKRKNNRYRGKPKGRGKSTSNVKSTKTSDKAAKKKKP